MSVMNMSLTNKGLAILMAGGLAWALVGCDTSGDTGKDTGGGSGENGTGENGTGENGTGENGGGENGGGENGGDEETGIAFPLWAGEIVAPGGTFQEGMMGSWYFGAVSGDIVCDNTGMLTETGEPPAVCPDCTWVYDVTVSGTGAAGDYCADFGVAGGEWDGFSASIGLIENYEYVYSGGSLILDLAVMMQYDAWGTSMYLNWWYLSGNYFSYASGGADGASFYRYLTDSSGNIAYYYYYL